MKKEWGVPKRLPSSDALSRMAVKATTMKVAKAFEKGGSVEGGLSLHRKRPATVAEKLAFAGDDGPRGGRTAERGRGRNTGRVDQGDEPGFAAARGTRGRRDERGAEAPARVTVGEKPAARATRGRRDERGAEAPARGTLREKPAARGTRGRRDERAAEAPARATFGEKPAARGTRGRRDERGAEAPARGTFGEKPAARGTRGRRDEATTEAPRGRGGRGGREGTGRDGAKEKPVREAPARRGAGRTERAPERAVEPRRSPRRR